MRKDDLIADCGLRISDCNQSVKSPEDSIMTPDLMRQRTKDFALRIIKLVDALPKSKTTDVIGRQLLRSGTSVGANYRSACRAKSAADFINKMTIVEEETDESIFWIELLIESGAVSELQLRGLKNEANELLAITVASINTARKGKSK